MSRFSMTWTRYSLAYFILPFVLFSVSSHAIASGDVMLQWDSNSEPLPTGYRVYTGTTSGVYGPPTDVGLATQHIVTNLQEGSTYYFVVTAMDDSHRESLPSTEVWTLIPDTTAPLPPESLQAEAVSSSHIRLTWDHAWDNIEVAGYNVYRNQSSIANTQQVEFIDTSLTPDTTYTYEIEAFDDAGNTSTPTQPVAVRTFSSTQPTLSIAIEGTGTVTSTPMGLSCADKSCSGAFPSGTIVQLTPSSSKQWKFTEWNGSCTGTGECLVTMTTDRSVGATFTHKNKGKGHSR
ncbi:fibronectin type III domain-containing protein [Nitrospira sp. M1]